MKFRMCTIYGKGLSDIFRTFPCKKSSIFVHLTGVSNSAGSEKRTPYSVLLMSDEDLKANSYQVQFMETQKANFHQISRQAYRLDWGQNLR